MMIGNFIETKNRKKILKEINQKINIFITICI